MSRNVRYYVRLNVRPTRSIGSHLESEFTVVSSDPNALFDAWLEQYGHRYEAMSGIVFSQRYCCMLARREYSCRYESDGDIRCFECREKIGETDLA